MKTSLIIFFACVATGLAGPIAQGRNGINPETIAELLFNSVAFYERAMQPDDPQTSIEFKQTLNYPDDGINVRINVTNGSLSGHVRDNSIDDLEVDAQTLVTKLSLLSPKLVFQGDYELSGTLFNRAASGKGSLRIESEPYHRVVSNLAFEEVEGSLQIRTLNFTQTYGQLTFQLENLQVEGLTEQEIDEKLITWAKKAIAMSHEWEREVAATYKEMINRAMKGKSIDQVIDWLKEHDKISY